MWTSLGEYYSVYHVTSAQRQSFGMRKVIMVLEVVIQLEGFRNKEVITHRLENDINPCSGGRNHHNLHGVC